MIMNQIPNSAASAFSEPTGTATTTIPAARLTSPYTMAQPRPALSRSVAATISSITPCAIHVKPTSNAIKGPGHVEVPYQHHAKDDEAQSHDRRPRPVDNGRIKGSDQLEDPREDEKDPD